MGDRAQVKVIGYEGEVPVYLYTHWNAEDLEKDVCTALKRGERWDDPEYLTRIIFCTMLHGDLDSSTGFGIGTSQHGDIRILITVDCTKQTVYVSYSYNPEENKEYSFNEAAKKYEEE